MEKMYEPDGNDKQYGCNRKNPFHLFTHGMYTPSKIYLKFM